MGNEGTLAECTETLLRNPDKLRDWISIVDKHMRSYAEAPHIFVLPKAHEFLNPLIQEYARNLDGFTQYILYLRDHFDRGSGTFKDLQAVYRRVNGRYIQQQRRERINRAVAKAEELYGSVGYNERMKWMSDLEHKWAVRRLDFLEAQRHRYDNDRLPAEDRVDLLAEFWETIDHEIYEGKVPPWN